MGNRRKNKQLSEEEIEEMEFFIFITNIAEEKEYQTITDNILVVFYITSTIEQELINLNFILWFLLFHL